MAFTQEQVDALKVAIASGVRRVSYGDRDVTYSNLDEMLKALRIMESEVAAAGGTPFLRHSYARFSRG